ncbi:MAG: IclR family transcriptional regulator [Pirellulaceae bacterium]|jgi:IclR family KDG regulon transcriptional repressor|nr:IclR family transcriptional regulator [Pirellulaceae bacterium]
MSEIKALARGLDMIDYVWNSNRSVGVSELATMLQIDKSSASRLARTLIQHGYLDNAGSSRRLIVGKRLVQIGCEIDHRLALRQRALPYLEQLAVATGESAHMAVHASGKALVVEDVEIASSLRVVGGVGRQVAMHCTAVGKALLAFCSLPMPDELTPMMPATITDSQELALHLNEIRRQGYAFDDEEHEPGVRCMAAPVTLSDSTIAVIGISGPSVRITDQRIAPIAQLLIETAGRLSQELRHSFQPPRKNGVPVAAKAVS